MPDEQVAVAQEQAPAAPTLDQRVGSLKGEARDHWQLHGNIAEAEKLSGTRSEAPASTETSGAPADEADAAQTAAASEPATTKEQPKPRGDRDFRGLRNTLTETQKELIAAKAKLELYEKGQTAVSRPSAPATDAVKPETSDRPDYPDISKYDNVAAFNKDVAAWKLADAKWIQNEIQKAATNLKQESVTERQQTERQQRLEQGRKEYKDFDKVAFNKEVPASDIMIQALMRHPQEHKLRYWLGTHLEEATALAEMTHIPGLAEYQKPGVWNGLTAEQKQSVMLQVGIAQGKAEAEISRIVKTLDKPAKETTNTRPLPRPSTEVSVVPRGTPVADELTDAIKRGDQAAFNRIQNRRDAERFKQGA